MLSNDGQSLFSDDNPREDEDKQTSANEIGPDACAWGMSAGITQYFGNQYGEYCCWYGKPGMPCAHNGCNATVHKMCQLHWLGNMKFDFDNNGPFFCPKHNIQWMDSIRKHERRYIPKKGSQ